MMAKAKQKIVIVGGGAGGLELATALGRKLGRRDKAEVVLVDAKPYHLWKPLLHEVATGSLDDGVDSLSYLAHARGNGFRFLLGTLNGLDRESKKIHLATVNDEQGEEVIPARTVSYDILVVAVGSVTNDFGTPGIKEHCIFLDSPAQAQRFHQRMLNLFLRYSVKAKEGEVQDKVNIAIVGGGATGVELSAELHHAVQELNNYGLKNLTSDALNISLLEAGPRILPALPERIAKTVTDKLTKLGVNVMTSTMVTSAQTDGLSTKQGDVINADLMVWAAGIKAPQFLSAFDGLETNRINQLVVKETLQTTEDDAIFAIGDCCASPLPEGGFVAPRAQAANQMAICCCKNIIALIKGKKLVHFTFVDKGSLVSLSKFSAVGSLFARKEGTKSVMIEGKLARLMYISLYRLHQIALHGYIKTGLMMLSSRLNGVIRPRLKLH